MFISGILNVNATLMVWFYSSSYMEAADSNVGHTFRVTELDWASSYCHAASVTYRFLRREKFHKNQEGILGIIRSDISGGL